ncbi:hypothetical protein B0H63DRAFT_527595 [Podospora didyma]|uniref:Uncharacterized protein n=1 Tax=Podospora didyma TaxID=330526 RepID=A0AAE0K4J6_9PEZI|nr:hypothetical protein B0H63DRAFT_527595 [Podospora didyma]
MEALLSMLACIFGGRRAAPSKYDYLINEKMPLYSDNPRVPYQSDKMMCYGTTTTAKSTPRGLAIASEVDDFELDSEYDSDAPPIKTEEEIADDIVPLLRRARRNDERLQRQILSALGEDTTWTRKLAEHCLDNIIECVEQGRNHMGDAMCEALDKATDAADDEFAFPRRHPESVDGFIAIVAVGILAQMQGAWVLEFLGFGEAIRQEEGAVYRKGSVASWWTREYGDYIPMGSVYKYLRALDMVDEEETGDL